MWTSMAPAQSKCISVSVWLGCRLSMQLKPTRTQRTDGPTDDQTGSGALSAIGWKFHPKCFALDPRTHTGQSNQFYSDCVSYTGLGWAASRFRSKLHFHSLRNSS